MPGVSKGEVSKTLHAAKTRGTPLANFPGPRPLGVSPTAGPNGPLASRTVSLPELEAIVMRARHNSQATGFSCKPRVSKDAANKERRLFGGHVQPERRQRCGPGARLR